MSLSAKKALFVFDGGLAPGYTAVATSLTEEGEKLGWECWAARTGFRSLCEGISDEPPFVRTVMSPIVAYNLCSLGPIEVMGRRDFDPGSDFRSERFPEFAELEMQQLAAKNIVAGGYDFVLYCGGDGTLKGAKALAKFLPPQVKTGFINISADSDIKNDRSVGFLSCAEKGAEIARGLYEDSFTHRRIYILEMMGNRSGRHALHAGVGARAHLVVLPFFEMSPEIMQEIGDALVARRHALIVVAEGYKREERKAKGSKLNAASYFKAELEAYGLVDSPKKRVIPEPFSRFIRGAVPLMIDCSIARLKCQMLVQELEKGRSNVMVCYQSEHNLGFQSFDLAVSDNSVEAKMIGLIDRLGLPKFTEYALSISVDDSQKFASRFEL